MLPPYPPSPPTPTSPTPTTHPSMAAAAAAAAAATLYGSSILPSICMQNVFLHYQKLMAECQTLGLNKLSPYSPVASTVLASPAKSEKLDIEEPHPLDLCTTNKMMVNNNNKTNVKTIWSPASSCEEENEMRSASSGNGLNPLVCHTCHRQFGSPTKLELHYRKVHHLTHQTLPSDSSPPGSKSSRKERIFKVKRPSHYIRFSQFY